MFSLEVLQSGAPYVHCQTCGLVPFLSFPVLLSLLIYPSLPSHLLHHLCSCNKQDSSCSPFHSFAFSSLLILDHLSHKAWHPQQDCLTDLFESHNGAPLQSDWLRRFCHTLRPAIAQQAQPVNNTALIFRWKHAASINVITLHMLSPWHVQDTWWLSMTPTKYNHLPLIAKSVQP